LSPFWAVKFPDNPADFGGDGRAWGKVVGSEFEGWLTKIYIARTARNREPLLTQYFASPQERQEQFKGSIDELILAMRRQRGLEPE